MPIHRTSRVASGGGGGTQSAEDIRRLLGITAGQISDTVVGVSLDADTGTLTFTHQDNDETDVTLPSADGVISSAVFDASSNILTLGLSVGDDITIDLSDLEDDLTGQTFIDAEGVGGTANAITLTPEPAITEYTDDQSFLFLSEHQNTSTTVTVDVSGLGARNVVRSDGESLASMDIGVGELIVLTYESANTRFISNVQPPINLSGKADTDLSNVDTDLTAQEKIDFRTKVEGITAAERTKLAGIETGAQNLTAAEIRTLLGLTVAEQASLITSATLNGRDITFNHEGGTTTTITIPDSTGTADGVVDSVSYNANTNVLTLSRSIGADITIDLSDLQDDDLTGQTFIDAEGVGGTANAITLTPEPAITTYTDDQSFLFISESENTSTVTVNISGLGVKDVVRSDDTDIVSGDFSIGKLIVLTYDLANDQFVSNIEPALDISSKANTDLGNVDSDLTTQEKTDFRAKVDGISAAERTKLAGIEAGAQNLTAAEIRTLLGLTVAEQESLVTDVALSGRVLTFTHEDGDTTDITLPDSSGTADGTVTGVSFNQSTRVLTLTRSIGSDLTIDLSSLLDDDRTGQTFIDASGVAGTSDAITLTPEPAITSYSDNDSYLYLSETTNSTTTPTVNISGVGAKTIVRSNGNAIVVGDISIGQLVVLTYDANNDVFKSNISPPLDISNKADVDLSNVSSSLDDAAKTGFRSKVDGITAAERTKLDSVETDARIQDVTLSTSLPTSAIEGDIELLTTYIRDFKWNTIPIALHANNGNPTGIAATSDGSIYVLDYTDSLIYIRRAGSSLWTTAALHANNGNPSGISVLEDGTIYVLDDTDNVIYTRPAGTTAWNTATISLDPLNTNPSGLTVLEDGTLYVLDDTDNVIYTRGATDTSWDTIALDSTNQSPDGLGVLENGAIYVGDDTNQHIHVRLVSTWSIIEYPDDGLSKNTTGLSITSNRELYALDSTNNQIYVGQYPIESIRVYQYNTSSWQYINQFLFRGISDGAVVNATYDNTTKNITITRSVGDDITIGLSGITSSSTFMDRGGVGGTGDAITLSPDPLITSYTSNESYLFLAESANTTTTVTANISGVGAKSVVRANGDALAVGDIGIGQIVVITYDGDNDRFISNINPAVDISGKVDLDLGNVSSSIDSADKTAFRAKVDGITPAERTKLAGIETGATNLDASEIRALLGLTLAEQQKLVTDVAISGRVITFTHEDESTTAITLPADADTIDGVVTGATLNPLTQVLTLTRSVGAALTVDLSSLLDDDRTGQTFIDADSVGGTANAITLTPEPAVTSYTDDESFLFIAETASTSATVTVDVSGVGARNVVRSNGTALVAGDIRIGKLIVLTYDEDNTRFISNIEPPLDISGKADTDLGNVDSDLNTSEQDTFRSKVNAISESERTKLAGIVDKSVTVDNVFPASPTSGSIHIFDEDVASGLTWKDTDGSSDITSASVLDVASWNGTNWVKIINLGEYGGEGRALFIARYTGTDVSTNTAAPISIDFTTETPINGDATRQITYDASANTWTASRRSRYNFQITLNANADTSNNANRSAVYVEYRINSGDWTPMTPGSYLRRHNTANYLQAFINGTLDIVLDPNDVISFRCQEDGGVDNIQISNISMLVAETSMNRGGGGQDGDTPKFQFGINDGTWRDAPMEGDTHYRFRSAATDVWSGAIALSTPITQNVTVGDTLPTTSTDGNIHLLTEKQETTTISLDSNNTDPVGVSVLEDGTIYVVDVIDDQIYVRAAGQTAWTTIDLDSSNNSPTSISVLEDGTIYVADALDRNIYVRAAGQTAWTTIALDSRIGNSRGTAVLSDGTIYVVDATDDQIYVRAAGQTSWTTIDLDAANTAPNGIAVLSDGTIYVVDATDDQIYVRAAGQTSWTTIDLDAANTTPNGIDVLQDGTIYVVDNANVLYRYQFNTDIIDVNQYVSSSWVSVGEIDLSNQDGAVVRAYYDNTTGIIRLMRSIGDDLLIDLSSLSDNTKVNTDLQNINTDLTDDQKTLVRTRIGAAPDTAEQNVQSDWTETDTASDAYIRNKPTLAVDTTLWKGTYADNTAYTTGDIVVYQSGVYLYTTAIPSDNTTKPNSDNRSEQLDIGSAADLVGVSESNGMLTFTKRDGTTTAIILPTQDIDSSNSLPNTASVGDIHLLHVKPDQYAITLDSANTAANGVSVTSDGTIYVLNSSSTIYILNAGETNWTTNTLSNLNTDAKGLSVTDNGTVYIPDSVDNVIYRRNPGETTWNTVSLDSRISNLVGVSVTNDGSIYCLDATDNAIHIRLAGQSSWTTVNLDTDNANPTDVSVTDNGTIYVTDSVDQRVYVRESNQSDWQQISLASDNSNPTGISVTAEGVVYVTDDNDNLIYVYPSATDQINVYQRSSSGWELKDRFIFPQGKADINLQNISANLTDKEKRLIQERIGAGTIDPSGFDGILAPSDDTFQKVADKLDDLVIPPDPGESAVFAARSERVYFDAINGITSSDSAVTIRTSNPLEVRIGTGDPNLIGVGDSNQELRILKSGVYIIQLEGTMDILGSSNLRALPRVRFFHNGTRVSEVDDHYHLTSSTYSQDLNMSGYGTIYVPSDNYDVTLTIANDVQLLGSNFNIEENWALTFTPFGVQGEQGFQGRFDIAIYQNVSGTIPTTVPTGGTWTWNTGILSNVPTGWALTPSTPSVGERTIKSIATIDYASQSGETITPTWSSPIPITGEGNVQPDWTETDSASAAYIRNKPTLAVDTTLWKGTYADNTAYSIGEIVVYQNGVYLYTSAIPADNTTKPDADSRAEQLDIGSASDLVGVSLSDRVLTFTRRDGTTTEVTLTHIQDITSGDILPSTATDGDIHLFPYARETSTIDLASGNRASQAVSVLENGTIYVLDRTDLQVYVRAAGGSTWTTINLDSGISSPRGLSVTSDGTIYVPDSIDEQIYVRAASGGTWTTINLDSRNTSPNGISVLEDGTIYVVDHVDDQIYVRDAGSSAWTTIDLDSRNTSPRGISVLSDGTIYVVNSSSDDTQDKIYVRDVGETTWKRFDLDSGNNIPSGISVLNNSTVYVGNDLGSVLYQYRFNEDMISIHQYVSSAWASVGEIDLTEYRNDQADWNETDTLVDAYIRNKPDFSTKADTDLQNIDSDLTNEEKNNIRTRISAAPDTAEQNVQSNWTETDSNSDAYIQNKPTIPIDTTLWRGMYTDNTAYAIGNIVIYQNDVFLYTVDIPSDNTTKPNADTRAEQLDIGSAADLVGVSRSGNDLIFSKRDGTSTTITLPLQLAHQVPVSASGFDGNLGTSDNDVQKVAQKFDDYIPPVQDVTFGNELPATATIGDIHLLELQTRKPETRIDLDSSNTVPRGISVTDDGTIYVVDGTDNQIYVRAPGTTTWATIDLDSGNRQPTGLSVLEDGTIYVVDRQDRDIYMRAAGSNAWTTIDLDNRNTLAEGLHVLEDGTIYVSNRGSNRGIYMRAAGSTSWTRITIDSRMYNPNGIHVLADGTIYIVDTAYVYIRAAGESTWTRNNIGSAFHMAHGISITSDGTIYFLHDANSVTDNFIYHNPLTTDSINIHQYTSSGWASVGSYIVGGESGQGGGADGVVISGTYDNHTGMITLVRSAGGDVAIDLSSLTTTDISGKADTDLLNISDTISSSDQATIRGRIGAGTSNAPDNAEQNVQADWNETDTESDAYIENKPTIAPAQEIDSGTALPATGNEGDIHLVNVKQPQFTIALDSNNGDPWGISVTSDGTIYVLNAATSRIYVRAAGQTTWTTIALHANNSNGKGVSVTDDGSIYVADSVDDQIYVRAAGQTTWTTIALDSGNTNPSGITVLNDGTIYVVDTTDNEIYVRDSGQTSWRRIVLDGTNTVAEGVSITDDGTIYVVDAVRDSIYVRQPGQTNWIQIPLATANTNPNGISVTNDGMIYVVDLIDRLIYVYPTATHQINLYQRGTSNWNFKDNFVFPQGKADTSLQNIDSNLSTIQRKSVRERIGSYETDYGIAFPPNPLINHKFIFIDFVASGLNWQDSDGTALTAAAKSDIASFNGTNWVKVGNLSVEAVPESPSSGTSPITPNLIQLTQWIRSNTEPSSPGVARISEAGHYVNFPYTGWSATIPTGTDPLWMATSHILRDAGGSWGTSAAWTVVASSSSRIQYFDTATNTWTNTPSGTSGSARLWITGEGWRSIALSNVYTIWEQWIRSTTYRQTSTALIPLSHLEGLRFDVRQGYWSGSPFLSMRSHAGDYRNLWPLGPPTSTTATARNSQTVLVTWDEYGFISAMVCGFSTVRERATEGGGCFMNFFRNSSNQMTHITMFGDYGLADTGGFGPLMRVLAVT